MIGEKVNIIDFEKTKTKSKKRNLKPNTKKSDSGNNIINYKISMNYLLPYYEVESDESAKVQFK